MAFIPDESIDRRRELTRSAWYVYEALCAFADREPGFAAAEPAARDARLAEWTGYQSRTVKRALAELRRRGWIQDERGGTRLLVGDFPRAWREA